MYCIYTDKHTHNIQQNKEEIRQLHSSLLKQVMWSWLVFIWLPSSSTAYSLCLQETPKMVVVLYLVGVTQTFILKRSGPLQS